MRLVKKIIKIFALFIVLVLVLAAFAHFNRVAVAEWALRTQGFDIKIGALDIAGDTILVRDARGNYRGQQFSVSRLIATGIWRAIFQKSLDELEISGATVTVAPEKLMESGPAAGKPTFSVRKIRMRDTEIFVGANEWTKPFGPVLLDARIEDMTNVTATAKISKADILAADNLWALRDISGEIEVAPSGVSVAARNVRMDLEGEMFLELNELSAETASFEDAQHKKFQRVVLVYPRLHIAQTTSGWNFARFLEGGGDEPMKIAFLEIKNGWIFLGKNDVVDLSEGLALSISAHNFDSSAPETALWTGKIVLPLTRHARLKQQPFTGENLGIGLAISTNEVQGNVYAKSVRWKDNEIVGIRASVKGNLQRIDVPDLQATFAGQPLTAFATLHRGGTRPWWNAGVELKRADLSALSKAMVPERFSMRGSSYLYAEVSGDSEKPMSWATMKFKADGAGMIVVKDLAKLLAATSLSKASQQQLLAVFDRGEELPYKRAWANAEVAGRVLTMTVFFERQPRGFVEMEVPQQTFRLPLDVLKQQGWLP
jgi:hypothetical protein